MPRFATYPRAIDTGFRAAGFDLCAFVAVFAVSYSVIIQPLLYFYFPPAAGLEGMMESRIENRIFWPALALISLVLAAQNQIRLSRVTLPPNLAVLLTYVVFAGLSTAWSFNPGLSLVRFVQETMVLASILLPALLARQNVDLLRGLYICFAIAAAINTLMIPGGYVTLAQYGASLVAIGYQGYFTGKNLLGEFAAITCLLSIYEMCHAGMRRIFGVLVAFIAGALLFLSDSKTAMALVLLSPALSLFLLFLSKKWRTSPAIIVSAFTFICVLYCKLTDFNTGRIAYMLTGDSSFTGRATIWNFAETEIARSPFVGWGYQAFWLSGPDAPSVVDAPGWVRMMPNAHSGYYDTLLELGYIGLILLAVFLIANLHVIGRVAKQSPRKAWLLLSIALFVMLYDFLETLWLRAFDLSWVVFVIVAADAARYWQPARVRAASQQKGEDGQVGRIRGEWRPRVGTRP